MIENLTDDQRKRLETAEKLFRVAGRSKTEAEGYVAKAMAILEELNLDMSVLEEGGSEKAKRSDTKFAGGRYKYQREVWQAVAELHFCYYWNQYNWDPNKVSRYKLKTMGAKVAKADLGGYRSEHRIVGRTVNVVASKNMAEYIETTIERLLRDHMETENRKDLHNSTYCISFRQGVASSMVGKVYERREHLLAEEQRKAKEAAERANAAAAAGEGGRSLTLAGLVESEEAANYDFLNGEGAWAKKKAREAEREARWKAERAERARKAAEAEAAYTRWAAENPEEHAKQEAERLKAERKRDADRERRARNSYYRPRAEKEDKTDWRAFSAGEAAGRKVSIDPQAGGRAAPAGLL